MIFCPKCGCATKPEQTAVLEMVDNGLLVGALCHCGEAWSETVPRTADFVDLAVFDFAEMMMRVTSADHLLGLWDSQAMCDVPEEWVLPAEGES